MERARSIAAAPVRSASEAWAIVCKLLVDTLEKSSEVPAGSVTKALSGIRGVGIALVAGGHLEQHSLLLVASDLTVTIRVLTGDAALGVEENLNAIPGGASADANWMLYLPDKNALKPLLQTAAKSSSHLAVGKPEQKTRQVQIVNEVDPILDLDAIRRLGGGTR